jgi:hypothetical protein
VKCEATTEQLGHVRCVVDWPHSIHLGWYGRTRVRWTDDGKAPNPEALADFEAECDARTKGDTSDRQCRMQ